MPFTARAIEPNPPIDPNELLETGWRVGYKAVAPALDGVIGPHEYGSPLDVDFAGDENPGRLFWGSVHGPEDLSYQMCAAYTASDLFLAFRVRDDIIIALPENAANPHLNDGIEVFIDGDGQPNDWPARGNREGFQIGADTLGNKIPPGQSFGNGDWEVFSRPVPGGYVMEFRIPLWMIDTLDGPGDVPATAGLTLRFNVGVTDNDKRSDTQDTYANLWRRDQDESPAFSGEPSWVVKLHLERPMRFIPQIDPKLDQEIARWREALRLNPNEPNVRLKLSHYLANRGEWDEANAQAREALRLKPDFDAAHNNLAVGLVLHPDLRRRSDAEALEHARRAVELSPDRPALQNTLGWAALRNGRLQEAESALQKSMEKDGCGADDWFPMAMLRARQGREEEARSWFDKAVISTRTTPYIDAVRGMIWAEAAEFLGQPLPGN